MDFADQQGKRILLIVENLGMLSEQLTENADWELRHTLQNEPRLMLLATAVSRFEAIANMGKAWFDLFAIHKLEPLGQEQCVELWRSVSGGELDAGRSRAFELLSHQNTRDGTMTPSLKRRRKKNAGDDSGQRRTTIPAAKAGDRI